jgi:hypothetical protein
MCGSHERAAALARALVDSLLRVSPKERASVADALSSPWLQVRWGEGGLSMCVHVHVCMCAFLDCICVCVCILVCLCALGACHEPGHGVPLSL